MGISIPPAGQPACALQEAPPGHDWRRGKAVMLAIYLGISLGSRDAPLAFLVKALGIASHLNLGPPEVDGS